MFLKLIKAFQSVFGQSVFGQSVFGQSVFGQNKPRESVVLIWMCCNGHALVEQIVLLVATCDN